MFFVLDFFQANETLNKQDKETFNCFLVSNISEKLLLASIRQVRLWKPGRALRIVRIYYEWMKMVGYTVDCLRESSI